MKKWKFKSGALGAMVLASLALGASLNPTLARAAIVPALRITADYYPDRQYFIGFDQDAKNLIQRIYFENETKEQFFYTLEDLESYVTIFKVSFVKLVRMKIVSIESPQSAVIEMQYVHNYLSGKKRSLYFNVKWSTTLKKYEIIDQRSGRVVHGVMVKTNYTGSIPIGIADVVTE